MEQTEVLENSGVLALIVTPEKAPSVFANFKQIETSFMVWKERTLSLEMTEEHLDEIRVIKKKVVTYRNSLNEFLTKTKKHYFNDPKAVFEAQMKRLLAIVGEVEAAMDGVLLKDAAKKEQERLDTITEVLDHYKAKFQLVYNLDEDHFSLIEYRKSYYNKTADEKKRKDDFEAQFKELKQDQDTHEANIRLILGACQDEPRLNTKHWIDRLQYEAAATLFEEIAVEKKRLQSLDVTVECTHNPSAAAVEAESTDQKSVNQESIETAVLSIPDSVDLSTDFPGRNKTICVEISYPCDLCDALTLLFKKLKQFGIKTKVIKEEAL